MLNNNKVNHVDVFKSVTERFEILKSVQNLLYFRVFPDIKTQRWFSVSEIMRAHAFGEISDQQYEEMIKSIDPIMGFLLYGIVEGVTTNSWEKAIGALKALENYTNAKTRFMPAKAIYSHQQKIQRSICAARKSKG
ncbi:hypothetical protein BKN38_00240 [Helicobacter sp. CLO-3]|uniref:hypothetical protein n=1 Tax=unclassified Helicobacter TaxID=2593540 RepID=UPI00080499AD|nr:MULTISPECIES: hypothetical protein [unclassified Helicobacter]OBV30030.1 hypothetical protein BA723_03150 [Helicobacter sp. CLO-3]OHU85869.1 hypothetical protein BKN38_00240 [Helicobacter sp. CLO-3]